MWHAEDTQTNVHDLWRGAGTAHAPRVCVVLPTYLRPYFPDRAITLVGAQTSTGWELIVIDDNDPAQPKRARTQARSDARAVVPRIHRILHASNRGGAAARNSRIRAARGAWIALLDDDECAPTKLEQQLAAAEAFDRVGLVYCRIRAVHAASGRFTMYRSGPHKGTQRDLLQRNHIGVTSCVMVRTDALRAVGMFDEALASRQDIDLYMRLVRRYAFAFVDAPLVTMHLHRAPRISTSVSAKVRGHRHFSEKHRHVIESDPVVLRARLMELGRYLLAAGELAEARRSLSRACSLEVRDQVVLKQLLLTFPVVRSLNESLRPHRLGVLGATDGTRAISGSCAKPPRRSGSCTRSSRG